MRTVWPGAHLLMIFGTFWLKGTQAVTTHFEANRVLSLEPLRNLLLNMQRAAEMEGRRRI